MNAIGLQNPGLDTFVKEIFHFLSSMILRLLLMYVENLEADYVDAVEKLGEQPVDLLEINISCPNVKEGGIAFGQVPASAELLLRRLRR